MISEYAKWFLMDFMLYWSWQRPEQVEYQSSTYTECTIAPLFFLSLLPLAWGASDPKDFSSTLIYLPHLSQSDQPSIGLNVDSVIQSQ